MINDFLMMSEANDFHNQWFALGPWIVIHGET